MIYILHKKAYLLPEEEKMGGGGVQTTWEEKKNRRLAIIGPVAISLRDNPATITHNLKTRWGF